MYFLRKYNVPLCILDLCGLLANSVNYGRSVSQLLHDPDMQWDRPTLTTFGKVSHRIYDHQQDPMQWENLAGDAEYSEVMDRLKNHVSTSPRLLNLNRQAISDLGVPKRLRIQFAASPGSQQWLSLQKLCSKAVSQSFLSCGLSIRRFKLRSRNQGRHANK